MATFEKRKAISGGDKQNVDKFPYVEKNVFSKKTADIQ
jgi:hypothetical protein